MIDLLWRIVDSVEFPLLVTTSADGHAVVRPMHLLERDGRRFWFATSAASAKVQQMRANPQVTLVFSRPDLFNYASVYGRVELLGGSAELRRRLWREEWGDHWPAGAADEDYLLLCVVGERASYYYGYMDQHEEVELPPEP